MSLMVPGRRDEGPAAERNADALGFLQRYPLLAGD